MTHVIVALIALGLALVVPRIWSDAPRADPERAAVSRSGVLGGAGYQIEVPAGWNGGLVVYAHGIQRGPGPGAVTAPLDGIIGLSFLNRFSYGIDPRRRVLRLN